MKLNHSYKEYYDKLWNYLYDAPCGEFPLKEMTPETREKFDNTVKHFISIDEFRVFNFYIEFTNDYTGIIKKEYPYNRMSDYNPDGTMKSLDN